MAAADRRRLHAPPERIRNERIFRQTLCTMGESVYQICRSISDFIHARVAHIRRLYGNMNVCWMPAKSKSCATKRTIDNFGRIFSDTEIEY